MHHQLLPQTVSSGFEKISSGWGPNRAHLEIDVKHARRSTQLHLVAQRCAKKRRNNSTASRFEEISERLYNFPKTMAGCMHILVHSTVLHLPARQAHTHWECRLFRIHRMSPACAIRPYGLLPGTCVPLTVEISMMRLWRQRWQL